MNTVAPAKPPTIQDVARRAGVSSATVSRVLNDPDRVSEAARLRVSEAIVDIGFTLNQSARSLRKREARTLLIALPNIGNPYYSVILDAVVKEASSRGFGVLVASRLGADPTSWLSDYFLSNRADGLLLFDASLDLKALSQLNIEHGNVPIVLACDELPAEPLHLVTTDNFAAAQRATQYLIDQGHRKIGHAGGRQIGTMRNERLAGFRAALEQNGIPFDERWLFASDFSMQGGAQAGQRFLALEERPTAVFCANDECLIGFVSAVRTAGLDYPADVSLIGFDDISISEFLTPPVTTMRQPREALGREATGMLLDLLETPASPSKPRRKMLTSELVVRGSVRALP